jgi:hypothetical protein
MKQMPLEKSIQAKAIKARGEVAARIMIFSALQSSPANP